MKVVWICSVSNPKLRSHLKLRIPFWYRVLRKILGKSNKIHAIDSSIWNTNAIEAFEKIDSVELHVVFTHPLMKRRIHRFREGRINFIAVNMGDTSITGMIRKFLGSSKDENKSVCKRIAGIVNDINPDIVHIMGAELPQLSPSVFYLSENIPTIVQLQTVLNDPVAIKACPNLESQRICEYRVLRKADYIGTDIDGFITSVRQHILPEARIVGTGLMVAEKEDSSITGKEYDFVYFAKDVGKSIDLALEAFALAHKKRPELTLDVIGGVMDVEKPVLENRIEGLGLSGSVKFEGRLRTHEEVITQVKKSRFALLPLKIDYVSSTIREAMFNGIPVVSSITAGTPLLNGKRESVLLSQVGDYAAMADNMIRLVDDNALAERLRSNGLITVSELFPANAARALEWVKVYEACLDKK